MRNCLKMLTMTVLTGVAVAVTGCGGGGGGSTQQSQPPQSSSAEGMWNGSSNGRAITAFVLDDGTYYAIYSEPYSSTISGIIQGSGNSSNGSYTTTNAMDYYFGYNSDISSATITANYVTMQSFNGTVRWPNNDTASFNATYDTRYDATPSLAALAGSYSGSIKVGNSIIGAASDSATITVASNGTISGVTTTGCSYSGTVSPRSHGNVFNINITMGGSPCAFPGQSLNGMIFYESNTGDVFAAAPTADRSGGFLFVGDRQ